MSGKKAYLVVSAGDVTSTTELLAKHNMEESIGVITTEDAAIAAIDLADLSEHTHFRRALKSIDVPVFDLSEVATHRPELLSHRDTRRVKIKQGNANKPIRKQFVFRPRR